MTSVVRGLYPAIEARATYRLAVGGGHELHIEESGNPQGQPAVVVHGGPGGGSSPKQYRFFDPDRYRIVLIDQRGCGASTPTASVVDNTTWDLVADLERVREFLGIERWLVFGGSWGSALSLAYSQTHPERVTELVLRGIFLLRRSELAFFYQNGASHLFPEAWEDYLAPIPEAERDDLIGARIPTHTISIIAGIAFLGFAAWTFKGDELDDDEASKVDRDHRSAIVAASIAFFLAELGDKTMLATITLATNHNAVGTWAGSTIGMVAADALAIVVGTQVGARMPEKAIRIGATIAFLVFGIILIVEGIRG